jgi:hypothetical protein
LAAIVLCACHAVALGQNTPAEAQPGYDQLIAKGEGWLVWESNRSGAWRIWYKSLDGSGLRQLSPDEPGRDHFSPHLSPDGKRLVYLSYTEGCDTYNKKLPEGVSGFPLYEMDVAGGSPRLLYPTALSYFEDRAVVWLDDYRLIFLPADKPTSILDTRTGNLEPLGVQFTGQLINASLNFATSGVPTFGVYDPQTRTIAERSKFGGCQPYFTRDGVWGFWMGGAGGPVNRIRLATRQVSPMMANRDNRLPKDRNYIYFPMVSANQRLVAFAASPGQHDHFSSDYDIFIAPLNPDTLELTGEAIRYTFDGGNDRFPDVFMGELPLGSHEGEAPFTVTFNAAGDQDREWDFGDGGQASGALVKHEYSRVGRFEVTAMLAGAEPLRGRVNIIAGAAPKLLFAYVNDGGTVLLSFDEAIDPGTAKLSMESGLDIASIQQGPSPTSLEVKLREKLTGRDVLLVQRVVDQAQRPNELRDVRVPVEPQQWPPDRGDLIFLWETAGKANMSPDAATGQPRANNLQARGLARFDHNGAMVLRGGAFLASDAGAQILDPCKASNELTIEAVIDSDLADQPGPARIISFSSNAGGRNFTLGQEGDKLIMRLRTPRTGANGINPQVTLCPLPINRATHVMVSYRPGLMVAYLDGKEVYRGNSVEGGFENWSSRETLIFGDERDDPRDWSGTLSCVALYDVFTEPEQAARHAAACLGMLSARPAVAQTKLKVRLAAMSHVPSLEEINPYRQALVSHEYEVTQSGQGNVKPGAKVRVAHWAILDGNRQPAADYEVGQELNMTLEPFEANPQLESVFQSDTLSLEDQPPLFYDVASP